MKQDLDALPAPVQKYLHVCGYAGTVKPHYTEVEWEQFFLKMAPDKNWTSVKCIQFNFIEEPARLVYMNAKIGDIIPFEGRDKYQDGHGNMLIKVLKIFTPEK